MFVSRIREWHFFLIEGLRVPQILGINKKNQIKEVRIMALFVLRNAVDALDYFHHGDACCCTPLLIAVPQSCSKSMPL